MRNREKSTEKLVRAAEIRVKAWQIFDTEVLGLSICIYPSGSRSFMFDYRATGRQRRLTIGRWPEWNVTAARERAKALRRDVDAGVGPLAEREETREAPHFPDLVERYLCEYAAHLAPLNATDQASVLKKLIEPYWKYRLVVDIRTTLSGGFGKPPTTVSVVAHRSCG